jgi:hypothetical protein
MHRRQAGGDYRTKLNQVAQLERRLTLLTTAKPLSESETLSEVLLCSKEMSRRTESQLNPQPVRSTVSARWRGGWNGELVAQR